MSVISSPIDRLRDLGGELYLDGEHVKYRAPDSPEVRQVLDELRAEGEAIRQMLEDEASQPPALAEVKAALPPGVKLVSYQPKVAPFAVAPVSVVTNPGKFYRAYLADLARRIAKPDGWHCPPLADILGKLADAELELEIKDAAGPRRFSAKA